MTTTKTYGDWHDLSEAVPARGVTEPVEVEYENGQRATRYPSGKVHHLEAPPNAVGPMIVRWRTVREHRPDANGWFRRGEAREMAETTRRKPERRNGPGKRETKYPKLKCQCGTHFDGRWTFWSLAQVHVGAGNCPKCGCVQGASYSDKELVAMSGITVDPKCGELVRTWADTEIDVSGLLDLGSARAVQRPKPPVIAPTQPTCASCNEPCDGIYRLLLKSGVCTNCEEARKVSLARAIAGKAVDEAVSRKRMVYDEPPRPAISVQARWHVEHTGKAATPGWEE